MKWGAIFDWDGVLADTSACHERSWEILAAELGRPLPPDHFHRGFGMKNERIIAELLRWTADPGEARQISLRKEEIFRELARAQGVAPLPGVRDWLGRLDAAGVPRVIASSTHRLNIETLLNLTDLDGFVDIVAAEDVEKGKPDPEVFLKAAARLGISPTRCAVFEDSPAGIEAGRDAGALVIAVATTHPPERLRRAHRIVRSLDELAVVDIARELGPDPEREAGRS